MPFHRRLERGVFAIQGAISIALLALLCCVVLVQVVFRYVLGMPLTWTEELSRFMFIWLTFVGFGVAVDRRREMKVELFLGMMAVGARRILLIILTIMMLIACGVLVVKGIDLTLSNLDVTSIALEIPWSWVVVSVPIGFGLVFIQYGLRLVTLLVSGEEDPK